jgi:hypothetical protein
MRARRAVDPRSSGFVFLELSKICGNLLSLFFYLLDNRRKAVPCESIANMELTLDRILAFVGIILTIVLLALDKAEKLKGAAVFYLLALAAAMTIPLAFANPWVSTHIGPALYVRRVFAIAIVIAIYSGLGVWIAGSSSSETDTASIAKPIQPGFMQFYKAWFNDEHSTLSSATPLMVHVWIRNLGDSPIEEVHAYFEARLVKVGSDDGSEVHSEMHKNAFTHLQQSINKGFNGVPVGMEHGLWDTLPVPLTQKEVDGIKLGEIRIYIYAWSRWKDSPRDLDYCSWLQAPKDGDLSSDRLIWHICDPA